MKAEKRANEREQKKETVVSLRWVLILASSAVILFNNQRSTLTIAHLVVALLMSTNFILMLLPASLYGKRFFDSLLVCADVLIVSGSIYITGQVNSDFFLLYFLVIMTAAISETERSLFWSGSLICFVYLAMLERLEGLQSLLRTEVLIRIPFFLIVSLFYGYLSQRARREQKQRHRLQKKLNLAARVRRYSRYFSAELSRQRVLKGLVRAVSELCSSSNVFVLSRGEERVVSSTPGMVLAPSTANKLLHDLEKYGGVRGEDEVLGMSLPVQSLAGFTLMPLVGDIPEDPQNAVVDLYLGVQGRLNEELLDNCRLLVLNGVLSLKNAGQYQALLHEVEKRRSLAEELQDALASKSTFVANVSHELRTPVNALIGFGELLLEGGYGELESESKRVINRMVENAASLRELINDLLDFSRLESLEIKICPEGRELGVFLSELLETSSALIKDKAVTFQGESNASLQVVYTDYKLLRQIALNLISNAIKFTPSGEVRVALNYRADTQSLELEVADTGIGIEPDEIEEIFKPFKQVDNAYTKRFAGTGLGLSITKREVELLQGQIKVESKPGYGSKFSVRIPVSLTDSNGDEINKTNKLDSIVLAT